METLAKVGDLGKLDALMAELEAETAKLVEVLRQR
jgi:hypothetical protein